MSRRKPAKSPTSADPVGFDAVTLFVSRYAVPIVALLVLLGLALCALDLTADPPDNLSWSTGPFTDDALNYYSARNLVLYGKLKIDDYLPFAIYPLANLVVALIFKLVGIGFVQVKLLSVLCTAASVLVMYVFVKEDHGPLAGIVAALLQATCYPLVMYGRLAMAEPVQILFLLLTGLFHSRGAKHPPQMLYCGLFAGTTILLVKLSGIFLLPTISLAVAWDFVSGHREPGAGRWLTRTLGFFLSGVGIALVIWLVMVYLPARTDYFYYVQRTTFNQPSGHPQGIAAYLLNTFTVGAKSRLFAKMPFAAMLGFLVMPVLAFGRQKPSSRYLAGWLLFSTLMLGYMNYRPDRHELVVLPTLVACAGVAIAAVWRRGSLLPALRATPLKAAGYALWTWPLVTELAFFTNGFWGMLHPSTDAGLVLLTLAISVALGAAGFAVLKLLARGIFLKAAALRTTVVAATLLLILRLDAAQLVEWYSNRGHKLITCGSDLDRALPDNAVVTGWWAPQLLVSSRKRALFLTDWLVPDDPIGKYGITHLVSPEDGYDYRLFVRLYPELMRRARVFREYELRGLRLLVFELPNPGQ